jgi:hypothetical protein
MSIQRQIIGWKEFVDLPDLGLKRLQAKIDTGAKTSALHVDAVERFQKADGTVWVRFRISDAPPTSRRRPLPLTALLVDTRSVRSSNGESERRLVIRAALVIGSHRRETEITLTNRKNMNYPILIGRTALRTGFLVNPGRSFLLGKNAVESAAKLRRKKEGRT